MVKALEEVAMLVVKRVRRASGVVVPIPKLPLEFNLIFSEAVGLPVLKIKPVVPPLEIVKPAVAVS